MILSHFYFGSSIVNNVSTIEKQEENSTSKLFSYY